MTTLSQYLEDNKQKVYDIASKNTQYNTCGRPVISKDDEWYDETEWDELFLDLSKKNNKGEN